MQTTVSLRIRSIMTCIIVLEKHVLNIYFFHLYFILIFVRATLYNCFSGGQIYFDENLLSINVSFGYKIVCDYKTGRSI